MKNPSASIASAPTRKVNKPSRSAGKPALAAKPPGLRLKKILVPVDFSDCSKKALDYALGFAEQSQAAIYLVHIVETATFARDLHYPPLPIPDEEAAGVARKKLTKMATELKDESIPVMVDVRFGNPADGVVTTAADLGVDLIVVSTHGFTGWKHALLGSVTERIVRLARCPVLVVREHEHEFVVPRPEAARAEASLPKGMHAAPVEAFKLKNILVTTDFSDCSKKALQYAIPLARQHNAKLTLLNISPDTRILNQYGGVDYGKVEEAMLQSAERKLDALRKKEIPKGIRATCAVRGGRPTREIVHAARDLKADLIVIATHGHTGIKHALLGSTAENVVRYAYCPVLTVREPERKKLEF